MTKVATFCRISIFAVVLVACSLFALPGWAGEKAGGGGIFSDNPLVEKARPIELENGADFHIPFLFTWRRDPSRHETSFLWPLFESSANDKGDSRLALRPFFCYEENPADAYSYFDACFGLFATETLGNEHATRLFPAFFHFSDEKSGHNVAFPFFWHYWGEGWEGFYLWPFYGQSRAPDFEWTSTFFPLYLESHDESWGSSYHVLWPLFNYHNGPGHKGFRLFPFVFYNNQPPSDPYPQYRDRALMRQNDPSGKAPALPDFCYRNKRNDYFIVFPFYWNADFGDTTHFHLWPFFGYDTGPKGFRQYSTVYPFFRFAVQDEGDRVALRFLDVLAFLGIESSIFSYECGDIYFKTGDDKYEKLRETVSSVFLLFSHVSNKYRTETTLYPILKGVESLSLFRYFSESRPWEGREEEDLRILAFLYRHTSLKQGEKSFFSLEVGPLFKYKSGNGFDFGESGLKDETEFHVDFLCGLFGYHRVGEETMYRILWLLRI